MVQLLDIVMHSALVIAINMIVVVHTYQKGEVELPALPHTDFQKRQYPVSYDSKIMWSTRSCDINININMHQHFGAFGIKTASYHFLPMLCFEVVGNSSYSHFMKGIILRCAELL